MTSGSRFSPSNPLWYEDLAPRASEINFEEKLDGPLLEEDLNHVDNNYVEISRTSSVLRGGGLFTGLIFFSFVGTVIIPLISTIGLQFFTLIPLLGVLAVVMLLGISVWAFFLIIYDCRLPRDTPVRFNRNTQKVYSYEYAASLSSFKRWHKEVKVYDWSCVEAEVAKFSGFSGKAYIVRYELHLVIGKPGTHEVIDRIALKRNDVTGLTLYERWSYLRRFMADGTARLPKLEVRQQELGFLKSLFSYMPYLSPTDEGRRYRKKMRWVDYCLALVLVWFFWLWLPLGLCHYVAMRCAPAPQWPPDLDGESRSGRSSQEGNGK
ncbi:DUF6708 domain-containing protein [Herbaspirillum seropedicae]|uniref:DUF6708 domain-containing protein n=1 Tax=Herbaspirillum seropedicae TaxID=964 RepID=UPI00285C111B|nr:DUF6708 domain-containing protein [Herbaspirillum seropedicae]MDR6396898.1 hypothetical protein [Herbaspirillum seropedicae]